MVRSLTLLLIFLVFASLTSCNFPGYGKIILDDDEPDCSPEAEFNHELDDRCDEIRAEATRLSGIATADMGIRLTDVASSGLKLTQAAKAEADNQLTHGFLILDVPNASSTPNILGGGCWPPQYPNAVVGGYLKVDAAGVLDGKCTLGDGSKDDAFGELSGQIDIKAGTLAFHLIVTYYLRSSDGAGRLTEHYTVDGTGTVATMGPGEVTGGSGATAKGSATYTWTCATEGTGIACGGKPPNYDLTAGGAGTVPFTMTFYSEDGH